jgi:pyruvate/2-oxoglutarate dehydrogenase complex dihydrolipoamide acyltransferase (E2) component
MAEEKPRAKGSKTGDEESDLTPEEEAMPVGAPFPSVITTDPSSVPNPYRTLEEQGEEMAPVIVGPPAYGSPDPLSSTGRLIPLDVHPQAEEIAETTYGEGYTANLTAEETLAPSPGPGTGTDEEGEEKATEAAQTLADEHGVNLADVEGTGKDGNVTKADVQKFIDEQDTDSDQS